MSSWQHRILKEASLDLDREGKKANTCLLLPLKRDKKCLTLAACLLGLETPGLPACCPLRCGFPCSEPGSILGTDHIPASPEHTCRSARRTGRKWAGARWVPGCSPPLIRQGPPGEVHRITCSHPETPRIKSDQISDHSVTQLCHTA